MKILLLLITLSSVNASEIEHTHAEEKKHIHGTHRECPLPKSKNDIVECAIEFHPSIQTQKYEIESSKGLKEQADQIPNPVFISRYVRGEQNGFETSELESSLRFRVELGNKRKARVDHASSITGFEKLTLLEKKVDVKIQTILNLYQTRLVRDEYGLVSDSIKTYEKVIKKLKTLPKLNADQEASLTLFEIALEESRVHQAELYQFERKLEHFFHVATGNSLDEIESFLPFVPSKWPVIPKQKHKYKSAKIKKLKSLTKLAMSEVEIEKSKAWPTLDIGPSIMVDKGNGQENEMVGLSVRVPIPFFQVNGGGKAWARSKLDKSKKTVELTHAFESHERFEQLQVYESSVALLKNSMNIKALMKKHKRLEKLYDRGVVSNQVYLDSLKQKINYIQRKNKRVMTALASLWNIYKFDGMIMEKSI